jgi:hypothetical protein
MSANVDDARLGRRLGWRFRLCRKLKHRCLLTLMQVRQENKRAIRKFECVVMHLWYVLVDLSKDRRPGIYRFRPPANEGRTPDEAHMIRGSRPVRSTRPARVQAGAVKLPGLLEVPRHSGVRSLLASYKPRRTPSASKSLV